MKCVNGDAIRKVTMT